MFGWKLGDERPDLVKALVAVEPNGPPFRDVVLVNARARGERWYRYGETISRGFGITRLPLSFSPAPDAPLTAVLEPEPAGAGRVACWLQAEPARQLPNLAKIPIAIVTGEASFRATCDHCTARFLAQAGIANTHMRLEEIGLRGNGHMMMMEQNSSAIAAAIAG